MSNTGIKLCSEFNKTYQELKTKHTIGYIVCAINENNTEIVIEETGDPFVPSTGLIEWNKKVYLDLMDKIMAKEQPRYIFFDMHVLRKDGVTRREKIVFFYWCPDSCPAKMKMVYAGTVEDVKKAAQGYIYVQACDKDDINYEDIAKMVAKSS